MTFEFTLKLSIHIYTCHLICRQMIMLHGHGHLLSWHEGVGQDCGKHTFTQPIVKMVCGNLFFNNDHVTWTQPVATLAGGSWTRLLKTIRTIICNHSISTFAQPIVKMVCGNFVTGTNRNSGAEHIRVIITLMCFPYSSPTSSYLLAIDCVHVFNFVTHYHKNCIRVITCNCSNCFLNLVQLPHVNLATGCVHVTQSLLYKSMTEWLYILFYCVELPFYS